MSQKHGTRKIYVRPNVTKIVAIVQDNDDIFYRNETKQIDRTEPSDQIEEFM